MYPPARAALDTAVEGRLNERRLHVDKLAAVVAFLQISMGALDAVSRTGCRAVLLGSLSLHTAHAWLLFGPKARWYEAHRGAAAAAVLIAVRLLTALSIQGCNNPTSQDDGVTFTFRLLYKTGFVPLLWYFIALPLPFAAACALHVLGALLYNRTLVTHACRCVFILPGDETLLRSAWRAIAGAAASAAPLLGGLLIPSAAPGAGVAVDAAGVCCNWMTGAAGCQAAAAAAAQRGSEGCSGGDSSGGGDSGGVCPLVEEGHGEVCIGVMTYTQVLLGVWAPLVATYVLLLRARRRLMRAQLEGGKASGGGAALLGAGGSGGLLVVSGGASSAKGLLSGPAGSGARGAAGKRSSRWAADGAAAAAEVEGIVASLRVSPLAVLFFTAAVSNVTFSLVAEKWAL